MTYDVKELTETVKKRRKNFLIKLSVIIALATLSLVLIFLRLNDTLTFVLIVIEFILLFLLYRLYCKYSPSVLFSREIVGENIMEEEYIGSRQIKYHGSVRPKGSRIRLINTGANRKPRTDGSIRSKVYLKQDGGDVICLSDLYKSNTDVYEFGDRLIKYAGTKYPVVISRASDRQPCPLCGEINSSNDEKCRSCGLKITK